MACAPHALSWQSPLSCSEQVVDVGGGTGFCTQGIVKTVSPTNVTLLDQSPHQLEKAQKKADLQGISIVEVPDELYLSHLICVSAACISKKSTFVPSGCNIEENEKK